jgi:hypothetical protein
MTSDMLADRLGELGDVGCIDPRRGLEHRNDHVASLSFEEREGASAPPYAGSVFCSSLNPPP